MASKTVSAPTAADVRAFFQADPKRVDRLGDPKAAHTVAKGARGRLHPKAIQAFNKGRKPERQYVLGVGKARQAEAKAQRAAYVAAGGGARGPMRQDKPQAATAKG